jgi:hypothetical protein
MESSELSDKSKEDLLEIILDKDNQIQELEEMVIYYSLGVGMEIKKNERLIKACSILSIILIEFMIASVYLMLCK